MTVRRSILLALAILLAGQPVLADILILDNGDRFSGQLNTMQNGELHFQSEFGQPLKLPWELVSAIATERSVRLVLADGSRVDGRLTTGRGGMLHIAQADGGATGVPFSAIAAINPPAEAPAPHWQTRGRVNFGASKSRGNARTTDYRGDFEVIARTSRNRYTLGGEAHYAEDRGVRSRNEALGYVRYDHFVDESWYLNSNASAAHAEFKDLQLRTTFGVGMGFQAVETTKDRVSLEVGINYVQDKFQDGRVETRPAARAAMDLERRLAAADSLRLFHRNETLVSLDNVDKLLFRSRTGVRFPLLERLSGTVQLNFDYDRSPQPGNRRSDWTYLFTLGYTW